MNKPIKPVLPNGFELPDGLTIKNRVERVFFTEVYMLSNQHYLYLFTNINPEALPYRVKKQDHIILSASNKAYVGMIVAEHTPAKLAKIIESLTSLRGLDSVAGMQELKDLLIKDVIGPLVDPEKFKRFRLSIPNGILLYGPPGCGKTFIVKKLSEELGYSFIELNPSSVATPFVHGAVSNIAKVFKMAEMAAPAIIFIDEIEGLIPKREMTSSYDNIKREEINEFLLQLNNAGDKKILVVGATNRPYFIDSAILRSGRMDKRVYVPPPDFEARKELFKICLSGRPHEETIDFPHLAKITHNYVASDIELIVTEAARAAVKENRSAIDEKMLIEVAKRFPSSITAADLQEYEKFKDIERW